MTLQVLRTLLTSVSLLLVSCFALVHAQTRERTPADLRSIINAADLPEGVTEADFGVLPESGSDQPAHLPLSTDKRGAEALADTTPYGHWDGRFGMPGIKGNVNAIAVQGNEAYVGGKFQQASGQIANNIAMWDGNRWHTLGNGVAGEVFAIAVSGDNVYVGGAFTTVSGIPTANIAVWSRSKRQWATLGEGVGGSRFAYVAALAMEGNDLYVGGRFLTAGRIVAVNIAKWNGTTWSRVGSGANGFVFAIAIKGGEIYVGGRFTVAGDKPANRVARVNRSTTEWNELTGGVTYKDSGFVSAIAFTGNDLYAGGRFVTAGPGNDTMNCLARYNTGSGTWSRVGYGFMKDRKLGLTSVTSLLMRNGILYVAGQFDSVHNITSRFETGGFSRRAYNFAGYTESSDTWTTFGRTPDIANAASSGVAMIGPTRPYRNLEGAYLNAMVLANDGKIIMGGSFNIAGPIVEKQRIDAGIIPNVETVSANSICTFDGNRTWGLLGSGLGGPVYAMAAQGNDIYMGGTFTTAGTTNPRNIAKWNSATGLWAKLGDGIAGTVRAIAIDGDRIYAGGSLTGGAGNIMEWSGNAWKPLENSPFTGNTAVRAVAVRNGTLYVGGDAGLHSYAGSGWNPVNGNVTGQVNSIVVRGDSLIVGGSFTNAGGVIVQNVAVLNLVTGTWSPLGSGTDGTVNAIAVNGSDIYVGGLFETAGGIYVSNVAKWSLEHERWEALEGGVDGVVNALTILRGSLFAGGVFPRVDILAANSISRWDGDEWYDVDRGLTDRNGEGSVFALADDGEALYVGGDFQWAGGTTSYYLARWTNAPRPFASAVDGPSTVGRSAGGVSIAVRPNPVSPETTLLITLPHPAAVRLTVHDLQGRQVAAPIDRVLEAGSHTISWNTLDLAEGMYFYSLRAGAETVSGPILAAP